MEEQQSNNETRFTKKQLLKSQKYSQERDIISAVFNDNESYTYEEAELKIDDFLRGEVK